MGGATGIGVLWTLTAPLRWVERARGNRRLALIGAYGLVVAVVGLLAWRQGSLRGLPDIGDPFGVSAFVAGEVPREHDAFDGFGRALDALDDRDLKVLTRDLHEARKADWAAIGPELHSWLDRNRGAMDLWREGAERPSATPPWLGERDFRDGIERVDRLVSFDYLALMEAARLESEGDMAGAWGWYRALFRSGRHLQRRGGIFERLRGMSSVAFACEEAAEWAEDPRVDATLLRRALADVRAAEAMTVPNSETHKAEYIRLMRTLDDPRRLKQSLRGQDPHQRIHNWNNAEARWYRYMPGYLEVRWWLMREPERSRRVARIAYANWLAHCDGLGSPRSPAAGAFPGLFVTDPASPALAFAYPAALHNWKASSLLHEIGIRQPDGGDDWRRRERGRMATLLVTFAREAYRREHEGREAPSLDALVGRYLDRLPVGYASDTAGEEMTGTTTLQGEQ